MTATLVLIRHGQSEWNVANLFTGWWDADLTEKGVDEARLGGTLLLEAGVLPDVVHTSLQTRAIRTANLALEEMGRAWIPVRRHWRLNERHYGDLQGKDKAAIAEQYGEEQFFTWRRSYDTPPPPIQPDNPYGVADDQRYAHLPAEVIPATECLKDVVERTLPYWHDAIAADLSAGNVVFVAAHGNSLRALIKHLDGISDADIAQLNVPTGVPLVYELADSPTLTPLEAKHPLERALGDPEAIAAAASAVAGQGR